MKIPLAWRNLVHSKVRTAVGVLGITFAVVLMFMQLGFLGTVRLTSAMVHEAMDFDVILHSPMYLQLGDPKTFSSRRIQQFSSIPGIASATPVHVILGSWCHPRESVSQRRFQGVLLWGIRPGSHVFHPSHFSGELDKLVTDRDVLVDQQCKAGFGQKEQRFGPRDVGVCVELNRREVCIRGCFNLGTGFAANAGVMMTDRGFQRVTPGAGEDRVSLGLIRFEPGLSEEQIAETRRSIARLAGQTGDVVAKTREEACDFEYRFYLIDKSIGIMFQLGVAVAVVVGFAIVYQVLSLDIARNLGEYATLKAMGYDNRYISSVVMRQATFLAAMGYLLGMAVALGVYRVAEWGANIPVKLSWYISIFVLIATFGMCVGSAVLALRKAYQADPADLF